MKPRDWNPDEPEMMDRPQPVSPELERDLENLQGLNQHFGSYALAQYFLKQWMHSSGEEVSRYRVLDLCTGYGDIPRMIVRWARARGIVITVDAVDFHPSTLELARRRSGGFPEIRYLQADARTVGLDAGSAGKAIAPGGYDLVLCSLALHHFSEEDAVRVLSRASALTCSGGHVLAADLERSWLTTLVVWLVTATIYRDPMTRYDAHLSARRAFSFAEFADLAQRAGWKGFGHRRFLPARQAVWKRVED